jgi:myo-inositol-1-phosphate synthase
MRRPVNIASPKGRLGVLTPGMGAVSTTFMAGVELVRRGESAPVGSLTQLGTIRLGKRTEGRTPKINEFVPLAKLDDIVFGGWDVFPDDAYQAASKAGVLEAKDLSKVQKFLKTIKPMKAAFDQHYVKNLSGPNVKRAKNKFELAEQLREDIRNFKKKSVW